MSAGRLGLLLVVGSLAGAAFAAVTTGALPRYTTAEHSHQLSAGAHPSTRSWLDQGVSALNSPAWPFGRGEASDQPVADGAQEYAPYGYGPPDDADDGAWERRQYGDREMVPGPAPYAHDPVYIHDPVYAEDAPPDARDEGARDAAGSAAARAADAAQDVRAAENTP